MKHPSVKQILDQNEKAIELLSKHGRYPLNGEVRKLEAIQILRELSKTYKECLKKENKCLT